MEIKSADPPERPNAIEAAARLATRVFALIVAGAALIALARPTTFLFALPHISWLLGAIMFGMGATLRISDFRRVLERPRQVVIGSAAQFGIMPVAGWGLAVVLDLPAEIAIGLILVGACPGGTASNVITMLARGDVALSVTMTGVSTVVAPIATPALMWLLAGRWLDVPAAELFQSTVNVVIVPVVLGILARRYLATVVDRATPVLPLMSVVAIALIVGAVVGNSRDTLLTSGVAVVAAVVLHNLFGLSLGWVAAKAAGLGAAQRRAIAVEVGMQNSGLAVALATAHFGPLAALPGAVFSVWHNLSGSVLATAFAKRPVESEEPSKTPEVARPTG